MKILILSDLCWERKLQKIKNEEVKRFKEKDLEKKKYSGIKKYFSLIKEEKPDLILFAGDITGDGSCGHGYQNAMKILLKILEANEIQSFFISGNHDEFDYFNELINFSDDLQFSKEISNQFIEFKGIKILGISFDKSKNKTEFKELIKANNQNIDIVLSHAELRRRAWLFDLNAKVVITGHFDRKIVPIENKIFISLDNDHRSISYCILEKQNDNCWGFQYVIQDGVESEYQPRRTVKIFENSDQLINGGRNEYYNLNGKIFKFSTIENYKEPSIAERIHKFKSGENYDVKPFESQMVSLGLKYLRGFDFKQGIERIRKIKNKNLLLSDDDFLELTQLRIDDFYNVSKTMIIDYVGKNHMKKNGVEQSAERS